MALLTVGMPTYDDYDGVVFSLQALRLSEPELMQQEVRLLVVDNNPDSKHGKCCQSLLSQIPNGMYLRETDWQGPWVKDLVVRNATTPWVLCMDSHVLLRRGALAQLVAYFKELDAAGDQRGDDLFHGPLVYDSLQQTSTHFEPVWRGEMFGIWGTDARGTKPDMPPFEIPMQGMGLFACRKAAWESVGGFSRLMRGFGGEEGYIHEKFRQRGRKIWCLPFLRWWHRFNRPNGINFTLTWEAKVRNYVIGHLENGLDLEQIIQHFVRCRRPEESVRKIVADTRSEVINHIIKTTGRPPTWA